MNRKKMINKNFNLYRKIFCFFVKKGKKIKVLKILNIVFTKLCYVTKKPIHYLLTKLFVTLNVFVETKTIKSRRNVHIVPFPSNLKRRMYLILKWMSFILLKNSNKVSFSSKLLTEILFILKKKKSEVLKLKILNNSKALANRSNIHYRW